MGGHYTSVTLTLELSCLICFLWATVWKSRAFVPFTSAQFAGEDPVVALEAALQFEDTRESMHAFCVGQYLEVRLCRGTLGITGLHPEGWRAGSSAGWAGVGCHYMIT